MERRRVAIAAEYNAVQPNFNPDVGFVRRGNMSQYRETRLESAVAPHETIQNLNFGTSMDYYKGADRRLETRMQEATTGIAFENSGRPERHGERDVRPAADAVRDPAISHAPGRRLSLPAVLASVNSGNRRKVGLTADTSWGEFWDGRSRSMGGGLDIRPNYHVNVDLWYSRNHVTLPNGEFTTQLLGARILYGFSPRLFVNAFLQVQRRHEAGQLEHSLQLHPPSTQRYLHRLQ